MWGCRCQHSQKNVGLRRLVAYYRISTGRAGPQWLGASSSSILTGLLVLVPFQKIQLDGRTRVIIITGLTAAGYVVLVYLIFFLIYTPVDIDHVRGVQGRYFVIALPAAAIFVASLINRQLPNGVVPSIAIIGSMISGATTLEALFRVHW
jgi:hypothetical protein